MKFSRGKALQPWRAASLSVPSRRRPPVYWCAAMMQLASDPNLVSRDPYGEGWIAEIKPSNWDGEKTSLATGTEGLAAYQQKLEADNISCA